ncbi:MAG: hypothetical protein HY304_02050 [candidate division Zixibacteria bacterium]|nr:hypothetical protein [candidate division Zixibacteria bacterium]
MLEREGELVRRIQRKDDARRIAYEFNECQRCHNAFPDPQRQMMRVGHPCPICGEPSEIGCDWPHFEAAHCLEVGLRQDWNQDEQRQIGVIFLAVGAEALLRETLFQMIAYKSNDARLGRAVMKNCEGRQRGLELFKVLTEVSLGKFWKKKGLQNLYLQWGHLAEERNCVAHGDLWGSVGKFPVAPELFCKDLLSGFASVHNDFIVPLRIRPSVTSP